MTQENKETQAMAATEEVTATEVPATIVTLPDEEKAPLLTKIVNHLAQGYATQDYVRQVLVHPNDVQFVKEWIATVAMPQIVRQLVEIMPNEGTHIEPGVILQSQVETEWLAKHYEDKGLLEYIKAHEAPLMLTHKDLKLLFLLDGVRESEKRRNKILIPSAG